MKVTAVLGSPQKNGVTSTIAKQFVQKAQTLGAQTNIYFLNQMDFNGCQGCHSCKSKRDDCILRDDLTSTLKNIKESEITVYATPVYYGDVSGQFKCFFDRTWSFVKPDYTTNPNPVRFEKGKKALFVISQGDVKEKHTDVIEKYTGFLSMYGFETQIIRAFAMDNELQKNTASIEVYCTKAKQIAEQMLS